MIKLWCYTGGFKILNTGKGIIRNSDKVSNKALIEAIRKDSESGKYVQYGYVKAPDGSFVQMGISADQVMALTESFSYQIMLQEQKKQPLLYKNKLPRWQKFLMQVRNFQ